MYAGGSRCCAVPRANERGKRQSYVFGRAFFFHRSIFHENLLLFLMKILNRSADNLQQNKTGIVDKLYIESRDIIDIPSSFTDFL